MDEDGDWYWESLQTWRDTGVHSASTSGSYAVARGHTYRIYVVACVYDDNGWIVETASGTYEEAF